MPRAGWGTSGYVSEAGRRTPATQLATTMTNTGAGINASGGLSFGGQSVPQTGYTTPNNEQVVQPVPTVQATPVTPAVATPIVNTNPAEITRRNNSMNVLQPQQQPQQSQQQTLPPPVPMQQASRTPTQNAVPYAAGTNVSDSAVGAPGHWLGEGWQPNPNYQRQPNVSGDIFQMAYAKGVDPRQFTNRNDFINAFYNSMGMDSAWAARPR